jgi:uncharacterized protein YggT (Ycf19 family)
MTPIELWLVSIARALVEVAGFVLLGQGLLYVLAGQSRRDNFVYQLFAVVTRPVLKAVRFLTPRFIIDRHLPFVAFAKRYLCTLHGLDCSA